jgi:glutaminase
MNYQDILEEIARETRSVTRRGQVADYIPALRKVPLSRFGMSVRTVDGGEFKVGDADVPFSIQSISKLFTLMLAFGMVGDGIWTRCGKEPSGTKFNSLVQLEYDDGIPRNPFINAGALVVTDCVISHTRDARGTIRDYARVLA